MPSQPWWLHQGNICREKHKQTKMQLFKSQKTNNAAIIISAWYTTPSYWTISVTQQMCNTLHGCHSQQLERKKSGMINHKTTYTSNNGPTVSVTQPRDVTKWTSSLHTAIAPLIEINRPIPWNIHEVRSPRYPRSEERLRRAGYDADTNILYTLTTFAHPSFAVNVVTFCDLAP